jgi:hypothetical protein
VVVIDNEYFVSVVVDLEDLVAEGGPARQKEPQQVIWIEMCVVVTDLS